MASSVIPIQTEKLHQDSIRLGINRLFYNIKVIRTTKDLLETTDGVLHSKQYKVLKNGKINENQPQTWFL